MPSASADARAGLLLAVAAQMLNTVGGEAPGSADAGYPTTIITPERVTPAAPPPPPLTTNDIFAALDANADGELTLAELQREMMERGHHDQHARPTARAFALADGDGDGTLSSDEAADLFAVHADDIRLIYQHMMAAPPPPMRFGEAFTMADLDNDGYLSHVELLRHLLLSRGAYYLGGNHHAELVAQFDAAHPASQGLTPSQALAFFGGVEFEPARPPSPPSPPLPPSPPPAAPGTLVDSLAAAMSALAAARSDAAGANAFRIGISVAFVLACVGLAAWWWTRRAGPRGTGRPRMANFRQGRVSRMSDLDHGDVVEECGL